MGIKEEKKEMSKSLRFNTDISIEGKHISETDRTFIIAEAGVNHNGDINMAKELIDVAYDAGADAVKFQTFQTDSLIKKGVDKAEYQKRTTQFNETQYDMLKRLELTVDQFNTLYEYSKKKGIIFLTTPFESNSLKELSVLDLPAFKIAATDITNISYLREVAKKNRPIILSAGMCYLDEVMVALRAIYTINKDVILLQCTANYPTELKDVNLEVLTTFKNTFDILVGFSDHTQGVGASPYAVAKGAKLIEKHFTLDKNLPGPDHQASLSPLELKSMINEIRNVELMLGTGVKKPVLSELNTRRSLQKCLVASTVIKKGQVITNNNITAKRTDGLGVSALYYDDVIGSNAKQDYKPDDII